MMPHFGFGRVCKHPTCKSNEILQHVGGCKPCPDYLAPEQSGIQICATPKCKEKKKDGFKVQQIVAKSGVCEDCPDFTIADAKAQNCIAPTCEAGWAIKAVGTCSKCGNYLIPSPGAKEPCIDPQCADGY